jgi:hypothetical protein
MNSLKHAVRLNITVFKHSVLTLNKTFSIVKTKYTEITAVYLKPQTYSVGRKHGFLKAGRLHV